MKNFLLGVSKVFLYNDEENDVRWVGRLQELHVKISLV